MKANDDELEAARGLLARLGIGSDRPKAVVLVTSAVRGEGRTSTCAALAAAAADGGLSVAAVDLDLRHPQLHSRFGVANEIGAAEIIHGGKTLDEARQAVKTDFGHICLITAGLKSGPPSLLAASGPAALLTRLSESFDLVLVDTPPVLDGGGVLGLAPAASDAVLVARIGRSRPQPATEARQLVEGAGVPVRGVFVVDRPSWRPLSRR